jgi:hypothetical protein
MATSDQYGRGKRLRSYDDLKWENEKNLKEEGNQQEDDRYPRT